MERHMKWLLNLLPVNKKREETGKLLLKHCFVLQWHIGKLWCVHILFTLSQLSKSLNFVHVIKQTWKDCCISYWFLTEGLENCSPPRTVLSNKSHDKVDFHVLFQDKPRSLSFTTNTFASTQLSLSLFQLSFFLFFNPHPISYTRIDLRKNRVVVRDWFD